jgi:signal transduction histidine kinase/response regulator of citrate/malate metabolism
MTQAPQISVLLVEDNPDDAELFTQMLAGSKSAAFAVQTADSLAAASRVASATKPDVIVLDLNLPDSVGLTALKSMQQALPGIPILVLTGHDDERTGFDAVNQGAQDYLVKDDLTPRGVARSVLYAIERRRLQEQLGRGAALLEQAEQIAGLGSFERDLVTQKVTWSDQLYRMYGVEKGAFEPSFDSAMRRIHPEDAPRVAQAVAAALKDKTAYDLEYRVLRGDEVVTLHSRAQVVRDASGAPIRLTGSCLDVTERKKLEQKLLFAGRMSSVGTLASGVAHEINNPLAYVLSNLDFIGKELRDDESLAPSNHLRELVDLVGETREGAERIRKIVRGLKTFSRADEERRVPVELRPMLELSITMTFNEIRHRARLVKDYGPTPYVEADESRLSQVFVNLLVNAAQAFPSQSENNEIRIVTFTDERGRAVVEVKDTGAGIPEAIRARIFDPFFTTKPVGEGTGLGLSICHGIVTAHGGEIILESVVGKGTTFRIVLPPAHADASAAVEVAAPRVAPGRRGKVLVVDDEPMVASALRRILKADHDIATAANGQMAKDRFARGERYDVILSDLMMPVMNGIEFYDWIAGALPDQADKIIFITGGAFTTEAKQFLDRIPNQRVDKPFEGMNIKGLVRNLVR